MRAFVTRNFTPLSQEVIESMDLGMLDLGDYGSGMNQPVTEGYVGKTKTLQEIEHLFGVMQKKYPTQGIVDKSKQDLEECPEKRKIEGLICKEFGFNSAYIMIRSLKFVESKVAVKSVLQRDMTTGMPKGLTNHGEKWYDKGHQYDFFCVMYTENFNQLTPGELTAMLLHEIGHCFDVCTLTYISDFFFWVTCVSSGPIGVFSNYFRVPIAKYMYKFLQLIDTITPVSILANAAIHVTDLLTMILGPYGSLSLIGQELAGALVNPLKTAEDVIVGVGKEKFADSFVTAYGYGAENISLLDKVDTYYITRDKNFVFDTWTWAGSITPTILCMLIDPHPEAQTRARMALDDLKKLKENPYLPKHMKASVAKDYERCKEAYELFVQVEPNKRDSIALRFSRNIKENILSGKLDLRTYFYTTSAVQDGIRKAYR